MMKVQWKTMAEGQISRFSEFRDKESLIGVKPHYSMQNILVEIRVHNVCLVHSVNVFC